jgi:hypothetical protein
MEYRLQKTGQKASSSRLLSGLLKPITEPLF